jgi:hypothetical protein
MTMFNEDDLDQIESEVTLRECCQSGCTVCVLDYQPTVQPRFAQAELLEAVRQACALVDAMEPGVRED